MENQEEKKPTLTIIKATTSLSQRNRNSKDKRLRVAAYCRVSTDTDEQCGLFENQVTYYTKLIQENSEWIYAGVYADEGYSGAHTDNRPQFMQMIKDALDGKIDLILMKSISRLGRNTLENIKYIRLLKERGISIRFEEEHVDTLAESGELMLTFMSSFAQQELTSTSSHVTTALKMKQGVLVGQPYCFGYDYDVKTKQLVINPKEAKWVKYIFQRYLEGAGTSMIGRELEENGVLTKKGGKRWADTTVLGILTNEKYVGNLVQGKTFTLDPFSKKRLSNQGEKEKYQIEHHHEAIIDMDTFKAVQKIRLERSRKRPRDEHGKLQKGSSTIHPFSSILQCGFCGHMLSRRKWNIGTKYEKRIWHCIGFCKHGKHTCPNSKAIEEKLVQDVFVEVYNRTTGNNSLVFQELLNDVKNSTSEGNAQEDVKKIEKKIASEQMKISKISDLYVDGNITKQEYEARIQKSKKSIEELTAMKDRANIALLDQEESQRRLESFKKVIGKSLSKPLEEYSDDVFLSMVEKVLVGRKDEYGNIDPYALNFILKFGGKDKTEVEDVHDSKNYKALMSFEYRYPHFTFQEVDGNRQKVLKQTIHVIVSMVTE